MRFIAITLALLAVSQAHAETIVLELNADERAALVSAIAAGLQAQPQQSRTAVYLLNKINTAPVEAPPPKSEEKPKVEPKVEPKPDTPENPR